MYRVRLMDTTMAISIRKVNISLVQCCNIPRIVDFLITHYFSGEPLSKYVDVNETSEVAEFLKKFCTDAIHQNVSMVATAPDGEIAAVSCNVIWRKDKKLDLSGEPTIKKISDFISKVVEECDFCKKYPGLDDYMYMAFTFVHKDFSNQGLTKRLIERTRELAAKLGLKVIRLDCWDSTTVRAAQKLGAMCLKEVDYEECELDDEQFVTAEESRTTFSVYVLKTEHGNFLESST